MEFSNLSGPLALSVLYPRGLTLDASPKAISGRTSYHQVRLAFHRYPQLIQVFCNRPWFGPPRTIKCASPWSWIGHLASGLLLRTNSPYSDSLSLRLRNFCPLTLPATVSRRFILQKARYQPGRSHRTLTVCKHTVSDSISLPSPGFFSPFPHGTMRYRSESHI
jgi:hypothetical protein